MSTHPSAPVMAWSAEHGGPTHAFAKELRDLPSVLDVDVVVEERRGHLKEGERDSGGDGEGGLVAPLEDGLMNLYRERRQGRREGERGEVFHDGVCVGRAYLTVASEGRMRTSSVVRRC